MLEESREGALFKEKLLDGRRARVQRVQRVGGRGGRGQWLTRGTWILGQLQRQQAGRAGSCKVTADPECADRQAAGSFLGVPKGAGGAGGSSGIHSF